MFRQFDRRKKLLHNLASVLMKFFTKLISKAVDRPVQRNTQRTRQSGRQGGQHDDLHGAKRWFRIAGSLQQTTKRKLSRQAATKQGRESGSAVQN
jgi:hypothetical protein